LEGITEALIEFVIVGALALLLVAALASLEPHHPSLSLASLFPDSSRGLRVIIGLYEELPHP
jgi:hypothetical protein